MFQIRQPDPEIIQISFVTRPVDGSSPDKAALLNHFAALLGGPIALELIPVTEISRTIGGKRERIVSKVADPG